MGSVHIFMQSGIPRYPRLSPFVHPIPLLHALTVSHGARSSLARPVPPPSHRAFLSTKKPLIVKSAVVSQNLCVVEELVCLRQVDLPYSPDVIRSRPQERQERCAARESSGTRAIDNAENAPHGHCGSSAFSCQWRHTAGSSRAKRMFSPWPTKRSSVQLQTEHG